MQFYHQARLPRDHFLLLFFLNNIQDSMCCITQGKGAYAAAILIMWRKKEVCAE